MAVGTRIVDGMLMGGRNIDGMLMCTCIVVESMFGSFGVFFL
jgi:hypothetical protein